MKKNFLFVAMATLMFTGLASCTNDDETASVKGSDGPAKMEFNISAEQSGGTRGYATTATNALSTITNFMAWAYDDTTNGLYMGNSATVGRTVTNTGTALAPAWTYAPVQFWPVNPLNFVAQTPATDASITANSTASATNVVTLTSNVTLDLDVEDQKDIMFAEADDIESTDDSGNVPFTFKHALSQIVFKGKFNNSGAITKVTVAEIALCNVYKTGVITFTSEGNFYGGTALSPVTQVPALSLSNKANFSLAGSDLEDAETTSNGVYTYAAQADNAFFMTTSENATLNNAWMLLPQTVAAWDGATVDGSGVPSDGGAYIKLRVQMEKDGVVVKGSAEADAVYLPLAISWDRSKRYIYTIEFNGTNALTPITFSVAAQDWTDASPQPGQIDM